MVSRYGDGTYLLVSNTFPLTAKGDSVKIFSTSTKNVNYYNGTRVPTEAKLKSISLGELPMAETGGEWPRLIERKWDFFTFLSSRRRLHSSLSCCFWFDLNRSKQDLDVTKHSLAFELGLGYLHLRFHLTALFHLIRTASIDTEPGTVQRIRVQ